MQISRRALIGCAGALPLFGGEFWDEKRSSQWSEAEVARLLKDSPWARLVQLRGGGTATVTWTSALPVQLAIARRDQGALSVPPAPRSFREYVITVSGLPPALAPKQRSDASELMQMFTELRPRGQQPLTAERTGVAVNGNLLAIEFVFPKDEITEKTGTVDFVTRIGRTSVRCRFRLADMRFNGSLAL
jgi:hypothetical protein